MNKHVLIIVLLFLATTSLTVKLNYDPKKGYTYSITGPSAEDVIDAEVKIKNYIRKGKIPPKPQKEEIKK
jgi:hypothetical protein